MVQVQNMSTRINGHTLQSCLELWFDIIRISKHYVTIDSGLVSRSDVEYVERWWMLDDMIY